MKQISKSDICAYLANLSDHCHHYDYYPIAWNIKMHCFQDNGRTYSNGTPICVSTWKNVGETEWHHEYNEERFDSRWETFLEKNDWVFNAACEWALDGLVGRPRDKMYEWFEGHKDPALSRVRYEMSTSGRSGGWLVLHEFEGVDLFRKHMDYDAWMEYDYLWLWLLYKFCTEIKGAVGNRRESIELYYADQRYQRERDWRDAEDEQVAYDTFVVQPCCMELPNLTIHDLPRQD